jgi:hypothetical protein
MLAHVEPGTLLACLFKRYVFFEFICRMYRQRTCLISYTLALPVRERAGFLVLWDTACGYEVELGTSRTWYAQNPSYCSYPVVVMVPRYVPLRHAVEASSPTGERI